MAVTLCILMTIWTMKLELTNLVIELRSGANVIGETGRNHAIGALASTPAGAQVGDSARQPKGGQRTQVGDATTLRSTARWSDALVNRGGAELDGAGGAKPQSRST